MKKMPDSENELKEAFTAFDADGDGKCCIVVM
jgi:Ca2+-binding EF-hand superfamily protein